MPPRTTILGNLLSRLKTAMTISPDYKISIPSRSFRARYSDPPSELLIPMSVRRCLIVITMTKVHPQQHAYKIQKTNTFVHMFPVAK
ncbi:hypothetical protein ABKN59_004349 [Abortiporus biennis]